MTQVRNCKNCGVLFIQTSKRELCDKCFEQQNSLLNDMNEFVENMEDETISIEKLLDKFGMSRTKFEELFAMGKFVKVDQRISMVCQHCKKVVPMRGKTGMLCPECTKKIQNRI